MQIAFITPGKRGGGDRLLAEVAMVLTGDGLRLAGVVQTNTHRAGRSHCDMDIKVLPAGPVIRINQDLGNAASGCRLDAGALETAVATVEAGFSRPVDLMIINKFGKHEAEGRGFRALIAEALARGIPVLTAVKGTNHDAFAGFAEGLAEPLEPTVAAILAWCRAVVGAASA